MSYEVSVAVQPRPPIAAVAATQRRETTGERWEVYGDWHEDPAQLQTMIFYRLR